MWLIGEKKASRKSFWARALYNQRNLRAVSNYAGEITSRRHSKRPKKTGIPPIGTISKVVFVGFCTGLRFAWCFGFGLKWADRSQDLLKNLCSELQRLGRIGAWNLACRVLVEPWVWSSQERCLCSLAEVSVWTILTKRRSILLVNWCFRFIGVHLYLVLRLFQLGEIRVWFGHARAAQKMSSINSVSKFSSINGSIQFNQCLEWWYPHWKRISQTANCSVEWVPCWFFLAFCGHIATYKQKIPTGPRVCHWKTGTTSLFCLSKNASPRFDTQSCLNLLDINAIPTAYFQKVVQTFHHISTVCSKSWRGRLDSAFLKTLRRVFWLRGPTRLSSLCSPPEKEGLMMLISW